MKKEKYTYFKRLIKKNKLSFIIYPALFCLFISFLIDKDIISIVTEHSNYTQIITITILTCLLIEMFEMYRKPFINYIDYLLIYLLITTVFSFLMFPEFQANKENVLLGILFNIILIFIRDAMLLDVSREYDHIESIIDIQHICNNKIELSKYDDCVLIEEKDVDYDLIDRSIIINRIYKYIFCSKTEKKLTIGINGEWGSGKTTIMNNVLKKAESNKKDNNFYIVHFNPCVFDDDKKMLEEFIKLILEKMDTSHFGLHGVARKLIETYFEYYNSFIEKAYKSISQNFEFDNTDQIEKVVNNILRDKNKKLLIIVDDLDRIRPKRIALLITFLDRVITFENTFIVLLYDKKVIEDSLKTIFTYKKDFIDKYINADFDVPLLSQNSTNYIKDKVSKNIVLYDKPLFPFLKDQKYNFDTVRDLKKYLNLLLSNDLFRENYINNELLSTLLLLQHRCRDLFMKIWTDRIYFLAYDNPSEFNFDFDEEKAREAKQKYFNKLLENDSYTSQLSLLEYLFPNIKEYTSGKISSYGSGYVKDEYPESIRTQSINNYKFFNLYFTFSKDDYIQEYNNVLNFIDLVNQENITVQSIKNYFQNNEEKGLDFFLEILNHLVNRINSKNCAIIFEAFVDLLSTVSAEVRFLDVNEESKVLFIIAELIKNSNYEVKNVIESVFIKSKNLYYLYEILDYYKHAYHLEQEYVAKFKKAYDELCEKIITENIDIITDNNYRYRNLRGLLMYDKEKERSYLTHKLNERNVINVLKDLIGYTYTFGEEGYNCVISDKALEMYSSKDTIDRLVSKLDVSKMTKIEKFVYDVYIASKNNNFSDKIGLKCIDNIDLRSK